MDFNFGDDISNALSNAGNSISTAFDRSINNTVNGAVGGLINDFNQTAQKDIQKFISKGPNQLLSKLGINANSVPFLRDMNAAITNAGLNAASQIFNSVVNRTLTMDIFQPFKSLDVIKSAIGNPTATALIDLHGITMLNADASAAGRQPPARTVSFASPYATDMADTLAPKFKFLYIVEAVFNGRFAGQDLHRNAFTFFVKSFDRPNVTIDHEEINMYNFRTKVPKVVHYEPCKIDMYDDNQNESMKFFLTYLRAVSPLSNIAPGSAQRFAMENAGMNFTDFNTQYGNVAVNQYSGSLGPLQTRFNTLAADDNDVTSVLQELRVTHVFNYGANKNIYHFYNPRITTFQLDNLTMESDGSPISCISFEFAYDGMYIQDGLSTAPDTINNIIPLGQYQMYAPPNVNIDLSVAAKSAARGNDELNAAAIAAKGGNPLNALKSNITSKVASSVGNAVSSIPFIGSKADSVISSLGNTINV